MLRWIVTIVVLYGLLNGGLWLYYKNSHSYEQEEYARLEKWFDETDAKIAELEIQADNAESDDDYNKIVDEHNLLVEEYDNNIYTYNAVVEVLNKEWYLIPIPLGKGGK